MKNKSEKRKNERRRCLVPVESKKGSSFEQTQTVDISKNGMGFISSHLISFQQKIPVEISFSPQSDPVLVVGKVQWVRPLSGTKRYRGGMAFLDVLNGSQSRLKKYFQKEEKYG